jgi:hypothetical protein
MAQENDRDNRKLQLIAGAAVVISLISAGSSISMLQSLGH